MTRRHTGWLIGIMGAWLALGPAQAGVTRYWIGGSGTWDDTTGSNWNPAGVPTNTDTVNLSPGNASLAYTAANLGGPGLDSLHLMNAGAGTNVFTLDGTDVLPVKLVVSVGRWSTNAATFNLTDDAYLSIFGTGSGLILGGSGGAGPFLFNQAGGVFSNGFISGSLIYIHANATFHLSGGRYIANRALDIHGGTFRQTGGTASLGGGYGMTMSAGSRFDLAGGAFVQDGASFILGTNAIVNWTGGTISGQMARIKLTAPGAAWIQQGGTSTVNRAGNTSAAKDSLHLVPDSIIQGFGVIQDARFGASSPATFDNSGRVVADGGEIDRLLDLSRFGQTVAVSMLTNTTDNTSSNGWFAAGKGALLLPPVSVTAGAGTVNWGESVADPTPDLVNSARIAFSGAVAGSLTGMLWAADAAVVPEGLYKPAGVWSFGGVTAAAAVVTFRYDDAAAGVPEAELGLWRHNGSKWVNVTAGRDGTGKTLTSASLETWPKAPVFFAVAPAPRTGTVISLR